MDEQDHGDLISPRPGDPGAGEEQSESKEVEEGGRVANLPVSQ